MLDFGYYPKDGKPLAKDTILPPPSPLPRDAANYQMDEGLRGAVDVALYLGIPLVVTGEPGTGKTLLAHHLAYVFNLGEPLVFNAKTTSTASDLFYQYDALGRFQSAKDADGDPKSVLNFIEFQALGEAVLRAVVDHAHPWLPEAYKAPARRSLVLIDEIDKAPRDLPNDILNEIELMQFTVPMLSKIPFKADPQLRPIIVMTSNSERDLPAAFLRRCSYYHIDFPKPRVLLDILKAHGLDPDVSVEAVSRFMALRSLPFDKKPATGELVAWGQVLRHAGITADEIALGKSDKLAALDSVMIKTSRDLKTLDNTPPLEIRAKTQQARDELKRDLGS